MKRSVFLLMVMLFSLQPALAQTRSASGSIDAYSVKIDVKDGIAFWDGTLLRVWLFPFKLSAAHVRQLKHPVKRRKLVRGQSYADVRFSIYKNTTIPKGYDMFIYGDTGYRQSNGGGPRGPYAIPVFKDDFSRKRNGTVDVTVSYKKVRFKYSGPVYALDGKSYKILKD